MRVGKFFVSQDFLSLENRCARILFAKVIVLRAEFQPWMYGTEFTALSEDFEPLEEGSLAPSYDVLFYSPNVRSILLGFKKR